MNELDYECDVTCDADGCKNHYFITSSSVLTTEQVDKIGGILGWTFVGEEGAFCAHHKPHSTTNVAKAKGTVAEPESARHFPASSPATSEVVEALKALTAIGCAATTEAKAQMPDYNGRTIGEWVHAAREALRKAEAGRQSDEQASLELDKAIRDIYAYRPERDSKPAGEKAGKKCPTCGSRYLLVPLCISSHPSHIYGDCLKCDDPWHNAPSAIGEKGNEDER